MPPLVDWGNAGLTVVGLIASATTAKLGAVGASGTGLQLAVARRVEEGRKGTGSWPSASAELSLVGSWSFASIVILLNIITSHLLHFQLRNSINSHAPAVYGLL